MWLPLPKVRPASQSFLLVISICLSLASASCSDVLAGDTLNLNVPGAMEKLRTSNPKHYEVIQQMLNGLDEMRYDGVARWIQTSFDAKDVSYSSTLLATEPPQRALSFVLGGITYRATVTLEGKRAEIYPVKH
jgi:hypothetical protein